MIEAKQSILFSFKNNEEKKPRKSLQNFAGKVVVVFFNLFFVQ